MESIGLRPHRRTPGAERQGLWRERGHGDRRVGLPTGTCKAPRRRLCFQHGKDGLRRGYAGGVWPDKADVIYDCAGNDTTMNAAIQNARKGSAIIPVAVFGKMANVDLAKLNDSELDLNTTMMYRHEDYVDAIRFVNEGKIQLKPLMTQHFAFRDYLKAYQYIDANREKTMKVLIDVQEP